MAPPVNRGVRDGRRDSDWIGGIIPYEVVNPAGDWTQFLPPGEWQGNHQVDTFACVSFSLLNVIETQLKFHGIVQNLSDRFTAKLSGTTPEGNYLWKVADSVRNDGVLPEYLWPAPQNFTWDTYYAEIPQGVKDLALKPSLRYEFLLDTSMPSLLKELKHAPLQMVIPGHAVMLFACENDVRRYFDSYDPYKKTWTSGIGSVIKMVYYPQVNQTPMTKKDVRALQALEGYYDEEGVLYWEGKPLQAYLDARLKDKIKTLQEAQ